MSRRFFDLELMEFAWSPMGEGFLGDHIQRSFDLSFWQRGEKYFEGGFVMELENLRRGSSGFSFESEVKGSGSSRYRQDIEVLIKGGEFVVDGYCSCPVEYNCKHVAAALMDLKAQTRGVLGNGGPKKRWIDEVSRLLGQDQTVIEAPKVASKAKKPASKTFHKLGFLLRERDDERLSIRLAKLRYTHGREEVKIESDYLSVRLSNPASYLEPEDVFRAWRILESLPQRKSESVHYENDILLDGELSYELIRELHTTGRLFLTEKVDAAPSGSFYGHGSGRTLKGRVLRQRPLAWGEPETLEAAWERSADGKSWQPVLKMAREHLKVYQVNGQRIYLDKRAMEIGDLKLSEGLNDELLNLWSMAPELAEDDALELAANFPQAKLRPPIEDLEVVEVTDRIPRPVLKVKGLAALDFYEFEISIQLLFDYGTGEPVPYLGELELPPIRKVTKSGKGSTIEMIARDVSIENGYCRSLEAMDDLERGFETNALEFGREEFILLYNEGESPAASAIRLKDELFPQLLAAGWKVIDQLEVPFDVVQASPEVHLDQEGNSPDWFRFQIGLLGESDEAAHIDLTELMAQFLAANDEIPKVEELVDPEQPIYLPHPASGVMLKLPCGPFFEVLHAVSDLLMRPHEPVHKLRAAGVAESLDMDDSETLRSLAELGKRLASITEIPTPELPEGLNAELRPYQLEGFSWMKFLASHSLNGVLADDMGLGKTVQSLAHLASEVESGATKGLPSLVVAPTSVVGNWMAESKKFTPNLKILELQGPDRKQWFDRFEEFDVVYTSYALINRDIDALRAQPWHLVILDEAQHIKNATSQVSRKVCELEARHRLCLSGTPVENHLGELWALYRFLMPGYLGNKEVFRKQFQTPIERHDDGLSRESLARRVRPLILRRTKDEVVTELPPKTEILHQIKLNKKQVNHYESVRVAMDSKVRDAIAAKGEARSQIIFLEALLKLRQICCDPRLLEKEADVGKAIESAKFEFLIKELLPTLIEDGRRILLFSQFTRMLGFIEEGVKELGIPYLKLTGRSRNRGDLVERFQAGEVPIFLISLKAGGTGLNLTEADTVIHYDPWWNPAAENQATDRAHRIGQQKPVFVHRLICEGTIESRIQELQKRKAKIAAAILDGASKSIKLDQETLSALLAPLD
mgnify:CR=1 FL=1